MEFISLFHGHASLAMFHLQSAFTCSLLCDPDSKSVGTYVWPHILIGPEQFQRVPGVPA